MIVDYICRTDVPDEQILRRGLLDVRLRRADLRQQRPGGPNRPDDPNISEDDQVHVPKVRCFRGRGEARRAVHPTLERGEREDIRVLVVLVHNTVDTDVPNGDLSNNYNIFA